LEEASIALDGRSHHVTTIIRSVVIDRAMHGGAVIPKHNVSDAPLVPVDELRLRGMRE
jgi:hypothetical protein